MMALFPLTVGLLFRHRCSAFGDFSPLAGREAEGPQEPPEQCCLFELA